MILDSQLAILTITIICFSPTSSYLEQSFVVEPENRTVIFGSKVVLPCIIRNKSGILQWTQNDFGLGDKRFLPGYERYRMIGSDKDGNYSLEIFPVTLEDEGKYQCQVSAGPFGQQFLRSKYAWITVIIPSEPPIILPEMQNGVLNVFEGEEITLDCISIGGRPSAEIVWLYNNNKIVTENITYRKKPFLNSDEFTATSTIRKIAARKDNNAVLSCQAQNGAREPYPTAQVKFNVLYPPKVTVRVELNSDSSNKTLRSVYGILIRQIQQSSPEYKWYMGTRLIFDEEKNYSTQNSSKNLDYANTNCSVTLETENVEGLLRLNISGGPDFSWIIKKIYSNSEKKATLICETEGNPLPETFWVDGNTNKVVSQSNILNVNHNSISMYYCRVSLGKTKKSEENKIRNSSVTKKNFEEAINYQFEASENVAKVECFIHSIPLPKQNFLIFYNAYPNGTSQKYSTRQEQISGEMIKAVWLHQSEPIDSNFKYHYTSYYHEINSIIIWFKRNKQFLIFMMVLGIVIISLTIVIIIYISYLSRKRKSNSFLCNRDKKLCLNDKSSKIVDCKLELVTEADDHSDTDCLSFNSGKNGFVNEIDVTSLTSTSAETFRMPIRKNVKHSNDWMDESSLPKNMVNINENYVSYVGYSKNYSPPETKGEQILSQFNQPFALQSLPKTPNADIPYTSIYKNIDKIVPIPDLENTNNTYINALDCLLPENLKNTVGDSSHLQCSTVWQDKRISNKELYKSFKGSSDSIPKKMTLL